MINFKLKQLTLLNEILKGLDAPLNDKPPNKVVIRRFISISISCFI